LFILINACCDIDEMVVLSKFHQWPKPLECVRGYTRLILESGLYLGVISVEDDISLPLFFHVAGVPQHTKIHGQWFKGLDVREGRTFWHIPSDEHY
jgi:hypothetical protein